MIEFWFPPSSYETWVMTVLSLFAIVYSANKNWQCSLALLVSLLSAKFLTHFGLDYLHVHFLALCAIICIVNVKQGKLSLLPRSHTLNYVVAYLFGVRIIVALFFNLGWTNTYYVWLVSMAFLGAQIFAVIRGSNNAHGIRDSDISRRVGVDSDNVVFAKKRL